MNWFYRKGIFFVPASLPAWALLLIALGYLLWSFFDIDSRSHSASDTLINWVFRALVVGAVYALIGYSTERS